MSNHQLINLLIASIISNELTLKKQLSITIEGFRKALENHANMDDIKDINKSFNRTLFYLTKLESQYITKLAYATDILRLKECQHDHNGEE